MLKHLGQCQLLGEGSFSVLSSPIQLDSELTAWPRGPPWNAHVLVRAPQPPRMWALLTILLHPCPGPISLSISACQFSALFSLRPSHRAPCEPATSGPHLGVCYLPGLLLPGH